MTEKRLIYAYQGEVDKSQRMSGVLTGVVCSLICSQIRTNRMNKNMDQGHGLRDASQNQSQQPSGRSSTGSLFITFQ